MIGGGKPLARMSLVDLNDLHKSTTRIGRHAKDDAIRLEAANLLKRIEEELRQRTHGRAW